MEKMNESTPEFKSYKGSVDCQRQSKKGSVDCQRAEKNVVNS